ncbi:MAG: hypothetical protein IJA72_03915 [Clostridia bacterium]|nr:hypothetical protein [Clostridia bacterium]
MEKIIDEFMHITQQLNDCAVQFKILQNKANKLKEVFNNTPKQLAEIVKLEKEFKKLNDVTYNLRLKASKLRLKKPE